MSRTRCILAAASLQLYCAPLTVFVLLRVVHTQDDEILARIDDSEKSQYLGGDVRHTHLVRGLDRALLHKVCMCVYVCVCVVCVCGARFCSVRQDKVPTVRVGHVMVAGAHGERTS